MYIYLLNPANYPECVYKIGMSAKESTQRLASYRGQTRVIVVLGVNSSSEKECKTLEAHIISNLESKYTLYSGKEYFIIPAEDEREVINMMFDIIGEHNRKNSKPSHELCSPRDTPIKTVTAKKSCIVPRDTSGFTYSTDVDGIPFNDQTGYVNATKLLHTIKKETNNLRKKQVYNWTQNLKTTNIISTVAKNNNIHDSHCIFIISSGPELHQGTYVHPDLVRNVIEWFDQDYASSKFK